MGPIKWNQFFSMHKNRVMHKNTEARNSRKCICGPHRKKYKKLNRNKENRMICII
jgi:hypothetical protein